MEKKYIINGNFYSQKTTGVHRFARELMIELDKISENCNYFLAYDKNAVDVPNFKNIHAVKVGTHSGILWEQLDFAIYARRNKLLTVNLCNSQPLLNPGIICIHDVAYKTHPEYFKTLHGKLSVLWHKMIYKQATLTKQEIITVSYFSKYSIIDTYKVDPSRIHVISNAWQHLSSIKNDDAVLTKFNLKKNEFYFTLGNINYNKNTNWVIEYAKKHPNENFVLSGIKRKNSSVQIEIPNVKYLGYLSDEEIVSLYSHCKAFIFPSIHEGFGIPPMEAMSRGAKIIVANTTCLPEIYKGTAYYIDAYDTNINLDELLKTNVSPAELVLQEYSWEKSAIKLKGILK